MNKQINKYMYICIYVYTYICIYVCMYVCMYVYIGLIRGHSPPPPHAPAPLAAGARGCGFTSGSPDCGPRARTGAHTCVYIYTYIYIYIYIHIYIYE